MMSNTFFELIIDDPMPFLEEQYTRDLAEKMVSQKEDIIRKAINVIQDDKFTFQTKQKLFAFAVIAVSLKRN